MFLSVVMPAYNEESSIEQVIQDHVAVLERLRPTITEWEIVCVDDASRDGTGRILSRLAEEIAGLHVVRHSQNKGIFQSFTDGYNAARGSHIYSTGSDGQWPPENLERMLERLLAGADLVIGVRTNRSEVYSMARRVVSMAFNFLPRVVFGVAVHDAGSVKLGVREPFRYPLISTSPFFEAERIIKACRSGIKVDFIPIEFLTRSGGKAMGASWKNITSSTRDLFRCVNAYGLR